MRFFIEDFEKTHNQEWPFGFFPAWKFYKSTGTHIGTDFKVPIGTSIVAPIDGEMYKVFPNEYKGNVGIFIFEYDGTTWGLEFCHLRELPQRGKYTEGQTIAYSGATGSSLQGAHLHVVLHRDGAVTKHYLQLQNREDFLRLHRDGAIIDCFDWFCRNIKKGKTVPLQKTEESICKDPRIIS